MFNPFAKKPTRRPAPPALESVRDQEKIIVATARIELMKYWMRNDPQALVAHIFPTRRGAALQTQPAKTDDPMYTLAMESLRAKLTSNPVDDLIRLQQAGKAMRELQAELAPPESAGPQEGAAGMITALANSELAIVLGNILGQAILNQPLPAADPRLESGQPQLQQPARQQPRETPARLQEALLPAQPATSTIDAPSPLVVRLLLAMLNTTPAEEMAGRLLDEGEKREDLNELVGVVLSTPDEKIGELLQALSLAPGWEDVAGWLLANPEYVTALVAELRRQAVAFEETDPPEEA